MAAGLFQNIRVYFLAISVYFGIVLFGYDTGIGGGVVAQATFVEEFMPPNPTKAYKTRIAQNVVAVLQAGACLGSICAPFITGRFGRRYSLLGYTCVFAIGAILQTVAGGSRGIGYVYAGRTVAGLGIGGISAIAPTYVSESAPKEVRGRITGLFQIMVASGVMISYFTNYGISKHIKTGFNVWRIPFGVQLLFGGVMAFGLIFCRESPRWLASKGRTTEALANLAYLRRLPETDEHVRAEFAEIEASIEEERIATQDLGMKEAFLGKGNWPRFAIAFCIFVLQQWSGQNTVGYYAPQIFESIGFHGTSSSLLASGVYGVIKVVATALYIAFGVETLGRVLSLKISAFMMGTLFYTVGAILKTHPPDLSNTGAVPPASIGMAAVLYIYCCFYSMGWGPVPWVYCADIFPTRTRAFGLGFASATQWFFNFIVSWTSLGIVNTLGWKSFMMFGTINLGGMFVFSFFLPETKGKSLEEMDIIFGSVSKEKRDADIARVEAAQSGGAFMAGHDSPDVKHSDEKLAERA
ncbi:sugar transporter [Auriculariales sp. MPI-PUGE-AT-0066]|nr:sugar transporter [Auriculariales sp. MPI-PUGE-AT-0066]